jgi:hypothetical protein
MIDILESFWIYLKNNLTKLNTYNEIVYDRIIYDIKETAIKYI